MELSTCLAANVTPLELPIQNNIVANGGYGSAKGVAISVGEPPQFFSPKPSFGTNNTWFTLADYCEGTQNYSCIAYYHGVFDPPAGVNTTNTVQSWNGSSTEDSTTRNIFYNDNAQIGGREIWGFPFFSYFFEGGGFTNPAALALGPDSSFINASLKAGITPNKQWSIWPGNPYYDLDGLLVLGGYDADRVSGQIDTYSLSYGKPWVEITGLEWESNGVTTSLMPSGTQSVAGILDPYVEFLKLPSGSISQFLNASGTSLGSNYNYFNSSEAPSGNMIVTLRNGRKTTIPAQDLYEFPQYYDDKGILQVANDTIQRCLVIAQPDPDYTSVFLGLPFMTQKLFISDFDQNVFYMADAVKQDFGSSAKNLQPLCTGGPTSTSTSSGANSTSSDTAAGSTGKHSSSHIGAIVGGVLGGIAALVLLGILAFFLRRRRNRKSEDAHATPEISEPQYNSTPPPKYPHAYTSNASSELGTAGMNQHMYNSGSTTPGLGVFTDHNQKHQGYNYSSGNASVVASGRADSERHELESDGPLAATSGPMDIPMNYDQRWH